MDIEQIRFVAYDINTAPKDPTFKNGLMPTGTYLGLDNPRRDIDARCALLQRAIDTAVSAVALTDEPGDKTLNVFMAPEFYFRGKSGAYQMDDASYAISALQAIAGEQKYANWLFVFGSIVAMADSEYGDNEAYNFVLLQQGGTEASGDSGARVVMKELMSGIDFVSEQANASGVLLGGVEYLSSGSSGPGRERQQVNYDGAGIFDLAEITWAVEVCLDHGEARLQKSPQLPGERQVQVQLVPSCGMTIQADSIITANDGLVFSCDGGGYGSSVKAMSLTGEPPVATEKSIAAVAEKDVAETDLEVDSPAVSVSIDELYAEGAGRVVVYPLLECPKEQDVPGSIQTLVWEPVSPAGQWPAGKGPCFTFLMNYGDDQRLSSLLSRIRLPTLDLHGHDYFLPMSLNTLDRDREPVQIAMRSVQGGQGYDAALWCDIEVPGFSFHGVAFEYNLRKGKGDPNTAW